MCAMLVPMTKAAKTLKAAGKRRRARELFCLAGGGEGDLERCVLSPSAAAPKGGRRGEGRI
jgi:hypothetical protein